MFEPGHQTERKPPFRFAVYTRVAFSDTDAQGVVYYGRYLPYFDLARTEYHRRLGEIGANRARVRHARVETSSTTPPRGSTTCSRSSSGSRGSGGRASRYEFAAYKLGAGDDEQLMVDRDPDRTC